MQTLQSLKLKDRSAIIEFSQKLKDFLGSKLFSLRLYGSKAQGSDKELSDIDIFIVVQGLSHTLKREIIDLAFDVNLKHDVYISPRVVSLDLFQNSSFNSTPFVRNVQEQSFNL
jgi:predicted nucleotidyltransferase